MLTTHVDEREFVLIDCSILRNLVFVVATVPSFDFSFSNVGEIVIGWDRHWSKWLAFLESICVQHITVGHFGTVGCT